MNAQEFQQLLISLGACQEGLDGTHGQSWKEVWETCARPDWLLWLLDKMKGQPGWPEQAEIISGLDAILKYFDQEPTFPEDSREHCRVHRDFYVAQPNECAPLVFNYGFVTAGFFGDLKKAADVLRSSIKVSF